jgi:hypothetical protein
MVDALGQTEVSERTTHPIAPPPCFSTFADRVKVLCAQLRSVKLINRPARPLPFIVPYAGSHRVRGKQNIH